MPVEKFQGMCVSSILLKSPEVADIGCRSKSYAQGQLIGHSWEIPSSTGSRAHSCLLALGNISQLLFSLVTQGRQGKKEAFWSLQIYQPLEPSQPQLWTFRDKYIWSWGCLFWGYSLFCVLQDVQQSPWFLLPDTSSGHCRW